MTQDRWPHITTSVSGISPDAWKAFKSEARARRLTYRAAMEEAIALLASAARRGDTIIWRPARNATSKPIKIHDDTVTEIRRLVDEFGYKQNVIIGTAMDRWVNRPE